MERYESEQVHRRISWLGTFEGFLFASLGFAWGKNAPSLILIISLLGLVVALLVFAGVLAAILARERIRKHWLQHKPPDYEGPDIFGFYPDQARFTVFTSPEMLLPLTFVAAWACVLIIR